MAVGAVPALFVGYFFAFPVYRILQIGLSEMSIGSTGLGGRLIRVGWFTLWQAGVSTALTLILAAPLTWAVSTYEFRGRRLVTALATVPFVLPTVVVGTAFLSLGFDRSIGAILTAHVFLNVAVVVRTVSALWTRIDPALGEAARVLGASTSQVFRRVTLPLLRPAIAAAASIVFLFTFTSFGVVLILGGFDYATLEVEIYRQAVDLFDLPLAASLALVQLVGVTAALYGYSRYQEARSSTWEISGVARLPRLQGRAKILVAAIVVASLGALMTPLVSMVVASLQGSGFRTLLDPDRIVGSPVTAVGNSLRFALAATVIATVVGLMASSFASARSGPLSRWLDVALMLPLGTSAVTIGFGFIVALDWPVDLRASSWLIPVAHALVAVPFVVRSTLPTLRSITAETREAAAVLGASPWHVWRTIDMPIVSRATVVGAGFALAISLGEFGATSFVARPNVSTIPTMIFRQLGRPGETSFGSAMALSVILAVLTGLIVMWLDRTSAAEIGKF